MQVLSFANRIEHNAVRRGDAKVLNQTTSVSLAQPVASTTETATFNEPDWLPSTPKASQSMSAKVNSEKLPPFTTSTQLHMALLALFVKSHVTRSGDWLLLVYSTANDVVLSSKQANARLTSSTQETSGVGKTSMSPKSTLSTH